MKCQDEQGEEGSFQHWPNFPETDKSFAIMKREGFVSLGSNSIGLLIAACGSKLCISEFKAVDTLLSAETTVGEIT